MNGTPRSFTWEASFPARATEHAFVPRLWATRRIGFLLDQIRLHGESGELREEVTDLARRYGIVTPYTAFLVLEDESRRSVPVSQRTIQAPAGDGRAKAAAAEMYKGVRETKSGAGAVGGAQALDSLKRAQNAAAPSASNNLAFGVEVGVEGGVAAGVEGAPAQARQLVNAQAARFVNGRTFYQNGNAWIDANVQAQKDARTPAGEVRVEGIRRPPREAPGGGGVAGPRQERPGRPRRRSRRGRRVIRSERAGAKRVASGAQKENAMRTSFGAAGLSMALVLAAGAVAQKPADEGGRGSKGAGEDAGEGCRFLPTAGPGSTSSSSSTRRARWAASSRGRRRRSGRSRTR